jgi:hypothetical protein
MQDWGGQTTTTRGGAPVDGAVDGPGAVASDDDGIVDLTALFGKGNEDDEEDDN